MGVVLHFGKTGHSHFGMSHSHGGSHGHSHGDSHGHSHDNEHKHSTATTVSDLEEGVGFIKFFKNRTYFNLF